MKLISMTSFVFERYKNIMDTKYKDGALTAYDAREWVKYANFLNQPLKLEMFVPCDEDEKVLEEPDPIAIGEKISRNLFNPIYNNDEVEQYQQVKEKVLFEGVNKYIKLGRFYYFYFNDCSIEFDTFNTGTIEDLVKHNLTLTPNAIKQLKL